ncbi:MAG TPA: AAA family ATPase [Candidatus Limnocylindrales bacterium]|nr:AAA family ATPase [Candidatus Limnocylindrales bacterium]
MENVRCPGCGEENPAKFRLCGFCGTALHPVPETVQCPSCGEENPGKFRLCGFCGAALAPAGSGAIGATPAAPSSASPAAPAPARNRDMVPVIDLPAHEVRKVVTLLFSDLKDSTAITASIDAEAMNEIKARYFAAMAAEIERHGGNVEKNIGDAIMAVFGRIRAREDDALRAVRAAAGTQRILAQLNEELFRVYGVRISNRTGVNTGEVVASTDPNAVQNLATGEAVNIAARLEQNAPANEVLLGEVTYDLVKHHVDVERMDVQMKGYTEPVPAYRLISVRDVASSAGGGVRATALVGREEELRQLRGAYEAAVANRGPQLITVVGEPGVGKSRLVKDFVASLEDEATVVRGRCLPYGDGITFWPLSEMARIVADVEQEDSPEVAVAKLTDRLPPADDRAEVVERLAAAINLSPARFPVAELFWGGRRFLELLGQDRPVIAVVDDIHSAETTFLEWLEHVLDASRSVPILVLCTARHALLEEVPEWGERERSERVVLGPLTAEDSESLVRQLLGDAGLDEQILAKVVTAAEGNPLFVEQMTSMLVDKGLLRLDGERWVASRAVADLAVPPSIQALLASRLDDLTREERAVVEPASVIGLIFYEPAIVEMVPDPVRPLVPTELGTLGKKQFVVREAGDEDADRYRFRHILIKDAAYGSLLKRNRAQLHERFVAWAERVNRESGREQEFEEILGYHLEQAYRYRTELGPIDEAGREVASRAATKLGNAGRRAYARGDLPAAASLLRRAAALLDHDRPARVEALCDLSQVIQEAGSFDEAQGVIEQAVAMATELGDRRLIARTRLLVGLQNVFDAAQAGRNLVEDALEAIEVFRAVGDAASEAHGWRLIAAVHGTAARYDAAAEASLLEIEAARRAEDGLTLARGSIGFAISVLHGPTPVPEALERVATLALEVEGDRRSQAFIVLIRAVLMALDGRFEDARALSDDGRRMLLELGPSVAASSTSNERARIELLAGDPSEAARQLTADLDDLTALGEKYFRANVAGLLSVALARLGDVAGAEAAAGLAQALADADDTEAQVLWRSGLGRARAMGDRADEAITLLREAADVAAGTTDLLLQADALADLGETLAALGRTNESGPPLEEALRRYEAKGARIPADRVRTLLSQRVLTA